LAARNGKYIFDVGRTEQEHDESVDAQGVATAFRHAVFERS
jgi:hypothetical protein